MPTVSFSTTVTGDIASFNADTYRSNVEALTGIPASSITVSTSSATRRGRALQASFVVTASIVTINSASATLVSNAIAGETTATLSTRFGLTISSVSAPTTTFAVVYPSPSPPAISPLGLNNSASAQTAGDGDSGSDDSGGMIAAIVIAVVAVLALVAVLLFLRYRQSAAKQPSATVGKPVPVEMMVSSTGAKTTEVEIGEMQEEQKEAKI